MLIPVSVNTISLNMLQALKNINAEFQSIDRQTNVFVINSGAVSEKEVMLMAQV